MTNAADSKIKHFLYVMNIWLSQKVLNLDFGDTATTNALKANEEQLRLELEKVSAVNDEQNQCLINLNSKLQELETLKSRLRKRRRCKNL